MTTFAILDYYSTILDWIIYVPIRNSTKRKMVNVERWHNVECLSSQLIMIDRQAKNSSLVSDLYTHVVVK